MSRRIGMPPRQINRARGKWESLPRQIPCYWEEDGGMVRVHYKMPGIALPDHFTVTLAPDSESLLPALSVRATKLAQYGVDSEGEVIPSYPVHYACNEKLRYWDQRTQRWHQKELPAHVDAANCCAIYSSGVLTVYVQLKESLSRVPRPIQPTKLAVRFQNGQSPSGLDIRNTCYPRLKGDEPWNLQNMSEGDGHRWTLELTGALASSLRVSRTEHVVQVYSKYKLDGKEGLYVWEKRFHNPPVGVSASFQHASGLLHLLIDMGEDAVGDDDVDWDWELRKDRRYD